ncbi:MAG: transcriptional repressor [Betaproteobacteria bacterium]|nr:transcriptional repressor [Betaproteobacteria bacterium]
MAISDYIDRAEGLLRGVATRVTRGRIAVLATLLESKRALSHHEVEGKLDRLNNIDRVTVYRVLEWLTKHGLAHRLSGDDRIWRFTAAREHHQDNHPHFTRLGCGETICLASGVDFPRVAVPLGYKGAHVEVTVKGHCPSRLNRKRPARRTARENGVRRAHV